jgi:hypothetical protein
VGGSSAWRCPVTTSWSPPIAISVMWWPRASTCRSTSPRFLGRSTGLSKGKAGAIGIFDPDNGIAWTTGIVGARPLIANGIALAAVERDQLIDELGTFVVDLARERGSIVRS